MLNRRQARMAERSGGLGHIVTPADRLAGIAHDPEHVGQRQLAGCGCFLPHLLIYTAGRSLGASSARPFSTVSVHLAIARLIENRGPCVSIPLYYNNTGRIVLQMRLVRRVRMRCRTQNLAFLPQKMNPEILAMI